MQTLVFSDIEAPTLSSQLTDGSEVLSLTCWLPFNPKFRVGSRAIVWLEGFDILKNSVTSSGI
jgi:hypothetical protein